MLIRIAVRAPTSNDTGETLVVLVTDEWNDWYKWKTMFTAHLFPEDGGHVVLGSVKVGQRGAVGSQQEPYRPKIPEEGWQQLGQDFISLGQDEQYYITLKEQSDRVRTEYLIAMRDCAFDLMRLGSFANEEVLSESLMRDVTRHTLTGRYNRLAHGNATPTRFDFVYRLPFGKEGNRETLDLSFGVVPESKPPTNVHVIIGRNAVGKTRALNLMVRALTASEPSGRVGEFIYSDLDENTLFGPATIASTAFAGLVSISFSAFDRFGPHPTTRDGFSYSYIGLKQDRRTSVMGSDEEVGLKNLDMLSREFATSAAACRVGRRVDAWLKALGTLESDPLFQEHDVRSLADGLEYRDLEDDQDFFRSLSSGHGIVLLIVTRLVELVEEQTLVLIDEPETHLHPPLLSAFIRAVSSHLVDRNGVAVIATHSPVVLQEVPRSCVWKLTRSGDELKAERPETESFGENVGTLTREVFGLEVAKSGFHNLLAREVEEGRHNYEGIVKVFDGQLGAEARSVLRSLLVSLDSNGREDF